MVQYKHGEDLGLDMHTDASDVTLNVCLGKEFTGAGLTFCGVRGDPAQPRARPFGSYVCHDRICGIKWDNI
mgnify:CR=1 FL=1